MKKIYLSYLFCAAGASALFGQWSQLNPMNSVRTSHVSASFADGNVLVAGGLDASGHVKSAEIYDVAGNSWTNTSTEMIEFHSSGRATLMAGGTKILVTGGFTGFGNTDICEIYDQTTDAWSLTPPLYDQRSDHSATLLQNGKILVTGGYDGVTNLNTCELYDPTSNTWSVVASMATGRSWHTATLLLDGKVLVAGGYNPDAGFQLQSTEIYDPSTDTWIAGPTLSTARSLHAASLMLNGNVIISGGESFTGATPYAFDGLTSVEIYNAVTSTFSAAASLPTGLCYHEQFTIGLNVLAIGGAEKTDYAAGNFTSLPGKTYLYNSVSDSWQENLMNLDGRINFTAVATTNNRVLVAGGSSNTAEMYDPSASLDELATRQLGIYPNPAANTIWVSGKVNQQDLYQISDLCGRTVLESTSPNGTLDISTLQNGVYLLHTEINGKLVSEKFVKQ